MPIAAMLALALLLTGGPADAKSTLPKPYVSRSLDLVLLPITDAVRKEFKLGKKAAGAVVASVEPGGTGAFFGMQPGDVISQVEGKQIRRPVDVDSMLRYGLNQNNWLFRLDGVRQNSKLRTWVELSQEEYERPVALNRIRDWWGYGYSSGPDYFYWADYCDYYYDDFYYVWDTSYVYIEEVIVTQVYITSITSNDAVFYYDDSQTGYAWDDADYIAEVDNYIYSDEYQTEYYAPEAVFGDDTAAASGADYAPEGYSEDPGAVDTGSADDGYVEPAYDASVTDDTTYSEPEPAYEDPAASDQAYEEPVYEEPQQYEEPVYEEPVYEEPAYVEPAYEEPVYEEPVYEEPAYVEPAYEEPAYDGGGGGECYYDEDGNQIC
jgi:hypothetical protein